MKCKSCVVGITVQDEGMYGTYFGYLIETQKPFLEREIDISTHSYAWFDFCPRCGTKINYPKKFRNKEGIEFIGSGAKYFLN